MKRLMEYMVLRELVTACRLAASPTSRSPVLVKATTDGVTRRPSEFSSTSGSPPSMTAMQELVVPKSIPNTFAIRHLSIVSLGDSLQKECQSLINLITRLKLACYVEKLFSMAQLIGTIWRNLVSHGTNEWHSL